MAQEGLPQLKDLVEDLRKVVPQWRDLGVQLEIDLDELKIVATNYEKEEDRFREMLSIWLRSSKNPSWKTIAEALRTRSVGYNQLALGLEQKYLSDQEGIVMSLCTV